MSWEKLLNQARLRPSNADPNRGEMSAKLDVRNSFESDFGRVVFSSASRRLHDKTQVFPLTSDDNIHSRLTHSMEVMNIGLSFAIYLSENDEFKEITGLTPEDIMRKINPILKTTCLVHDIGNPPFGHFGEVVFQEYFKDLFQELRVALHGKECHSLVATHVAKELKEEKQREQLQVFLANDNWTADYIHFDGNAEGLRVLTKLQYIGDLTGLNLTFGTLAASLKYPNFGQPDKYGPIAKHKHGIFETEREYVNSIANKCELVNQDGSYKRHPLSFLMEASDSICYYVMDIEDAISKGWFDSRYVLKSLMESDVISEEVKQKLDKNRKTNGGETVEEDNPTIKEWVMLRTALLSHLMEVATKNFVNHLNEIENGTYNEELIEDGDGVYKVLKQITKKQILNRREIISLEVTGRAVITGLFDALLFMLFHSNDGVRSRAKVLVSKSIYKSVLHEHKIAVGEEVNGKDIDKMYEDHDPSEFTAEERFRLVRDYVACMTDKFALTQYQRISGQKI